MGPLRKLIAAARAAWDRDRAASNALPSPEARSPEREARADVPVSPCMAEEIAALRAWLGRAVCVRGGEQRPVLQQAPRILGAGSPLYRVHWQASAEAVRHDLERRPNFFGVNEEIADEYARGQPAQGLRPYLVSAHAKRPLVLADLAAYEVFKIVEFGDDIGGSGRTGPFRALKADPRFRSDAIGVQRWLAWEAACGLRPADAPELDGVWDNDGQDVLVARPAAALELVVSPYRS